jgi:hemolysin III
MKMNYLKYEESVKKWYRPRHPFVAAHDLVVVVVVTIFSLITSSWQQLYFLVVVAMFAVSSLHHWLPYESWHHRLDRSMIQIMIAGTPLPYTIEIIGNGDFMLLVLLWGSAVLFFIIKIVFGYLTRQGFWSAAVYVVTGLLAVAVMIPVQSKSIFWTVIFWSGVGIYALQLLSYNRKWFDFFPERFGYREVQHLMLLAAVCCHAVAMFVF